MGAAGVGAAGGADDESARQRMYWEQYQSERRPPEHPSVRALFEPRAEYLASLVDDAASASVVDVGCGNGFLTVYLERVFGRAVGVDYSESMLAASPCREKVCASATELPFEDGEFDVAVESHLLHHLEPADRAQAVREMARVARRAVVLYEPNRNNPLMFAFGALKKEERMSLAFSPRYVGSLLSETGLPGRSVRVEGMIVPNKAPAAWAPVAGLLERTPLRVLGFYTRAAAVAGEAGRAGEGNGR